MPLAVVLWLALAGLVLAFAAGWLGSRGAVRGLTRRVNAHDDDLEAITARLSRRDGQMGGLVAQARRRTKDEVWAEALAAQVARGSASGEAGAVAPAQAPPRSHAEIAAMARTRGLGVLKNGAEG